MIKTLVFAVAVLASSTSMCSADPYKEGIRDYYDGTCYRARPYVDGSEKEIRWKRGFRHAQRLDRDRVDRSHCRGTAGAAERRFCDDMHDTWMCATEPDPTSPICTNPLSREQGGGLNFITCDYWWGLPLMCMNTTMKEARWILGKRYLDCLYREEMPLPRPRPRKARLSLFTPAQRNV
jgi:hypothetical protein